MDVGVGKRRFTIVVTGNRTAQLAGSRCTASGKKRWRAPGALYKWIGGL